MYRGNLFQCPELPTIMENEILTNFQMTCFRIASMCSKYIEKVMVISNKSFHYEI